MQVLTPPLQHPCWEWGLSSPLPPCPGTRACWGVRAGSGSLSEWKEPRGGPLAGQVLRGSWNLDSQRLATAWRFEAARVRGGGQACTFPRSCHRVRRERSPCAQLPRPPLSISVSVARSPAGPLLGAAQGWTKCRAGPAGEGPASERSHLLAALTFCGLGIGGTLCKASGGGRGCAAPSL